MSWAGHTEAAMARKMFIAGAIYPSSSHFDAPSPLIIATRRFSRYVMVDGASKPLLPFIGASSMRRA